GDPRSLLVGASGALCGLLLSLAVWVILNRRYLPPALTSSLIRNVGINTVLIAFISFLPGVSWAGHLGGAVAGAAVAVPLNLQRFGAGLQRWLGLLGIIAVPLVAIGLLTRTIVPAEQAGRPDQAEVQAARALLLREYWKADKTVVDT